jgi:hypothetical protein
MATATDEIKDKDSCKVAPHWKGAGNHDAEVSGDTLVQLFCTSSSGIIGSEYEYEIGDSQ